jgi:UDPglucose--hexose-1-phosphate uridylyltransferase
MSERRWHPVLGEWVITATHRQDRTFLPPPGYCPLCPTREGGIPTEVPEADYDIVVFDNKFPSMAFNAPEPSVQASELCAVKPSLGACEVVVYSSKHDSTMADMPTEQLIKLIHVWKDRYAELGAREEIAYVFIFENKGEAIGVTMHHPHGQIYAFPFIPPRIQRQLDMEEAHYQKHERCLHCDIITSELRAMERLVAENERFVAFVPFYARFPYEVHVYAKKHLSSLSEVDESTCVDLAQMLHVVLQKYDNLWNISMPYIMVMQQEPTDGRTHRGSHFRIEFSPPLRTKEKLKYLAGCESGAGTFVNDTLPEEKAAELRSALPHSEAAHG